RVKLGSVAVGARGERVGLAAAEQLAPGAEPLVRPTRTFTGDGILQRRVGEEEIPSLVRRRLIGLSGAHAPILRHYRDGAARARSTASMSTLDRGFRPEHLTDRV